MAFLERLGRIVTPGRRLIPQIDGLRFVAISSVFYYHVAH
jgi:peptidoglycan/LPS O-acetylase OafA/YrhL